MGESDQLNIVCIGWINDIYTRDSGINRLFVCAPVFIIALLVFYMAVGDAINKLFKATVHPQCNIDPLCHPGFVRKEDGSGWIGNVCVGAR